MMDPSVQFQRYDTSFKMLENDFNFLKDEQDYLKKELNELIEENKKSQNAFVLISSNFLIKFNYN
jgi:hypothetical protein